MLASPATTTSHLHLHEPVWSRIKELAACEANDWKWREPFFEAAKTVGLPASATSGAYAGVKLSSLIKHLGQLESFDHLKQPEEPTAENLDDFDIVFACGKLVKKPKWPCLTLEQMARQPAAQQRYKSLVQSEKDSFALLNAAFAREALFCRLPDGYCGKIRILFDGNSSVSSLLASRLTLWVGADSQIEIECSSRQTQKGSLKAPLNLDLIDLVLESSSHVQMSWERASSGMNLSFLRASLAKAAKLDFIDLSEGANISRLDAQIKLLEEGAHADLKGLALLDAQQQNQTHVRIEHVAESCESSQLFKVLLKGQSRSHFQGKIYVHPQAQKTQAYQLNRNLLLSDQAIAQSWPNLEIFADDVKASHGSTTGPVDSEALFYLLSRGIDKQTASSLLAHGFALEVLPGSTKGLLFEKWKQKVMAL